MNLDRRRRGRGRYGRTHPRRLEAGMAWKEGAGAVFSAQNASGSRYRQDSPTLVRRARKNVTRIARLEAKGRAVLASPFHSDYSGINHISVGEAP